jgi:DNA-directed RNA polymerase subunit RPC12/RpoP
MMLKCPYCKIFGMLVKLGAGRYICRNCGRTVKEN